MKKILIACVNHNSYSELDNFLSSVDIAASQVQETCEVVVLVADNSSVKQHFEKNNLKAIQYYVYIVNNVGYINSAQAAIENYRKEQIESFDFTIVSNVDICLAHDFFIQLITTPTQQVAWIAPRIYTPSSKSEENPYALHRYSKRKLKTLHFMYSHPWLLMCHKHFTHLLVGWKRKKDSSIKDVRKIYAGHGSILIFTRPFMQYIFPFNYPFFLYGEELYFAELALSLDMQTVYNPYIFVNNCSAHISTSHLKFAKICEYGKQAISYIITKYY